MIKLQLAKAPVKQPYQLGSNAKTPARQKGLGDTFTAFSASPTDAVSKILTQVTYGSTGKNGNTVSGLTNIASLIKGDQTTFSNQSQTQQIRLQLPMTEVQQEWTIIATMMTTTLNQSYMTLAQSIYKKGAKKCLNRL